MADYTRNYNFQANTTIQSSQVDEEFDDVVTAIASKPDADGTLQSNLNADEVDGYDAADNGGTGTIPICSGTMQTNLNAEMLGGATLSDISQAGFPSGTKMLFYQSSAPSGWTKESNPSIDRVIGVSSGGNGGLDNSTTSWGTSNYTVSVAAHTLTIAEVPAVTLSSGTYAYYTSAGGLSGAPTSSGTGSGASLTTASLGGTTDGGGGSHTHTGSSCTRSTGYRPPIRFVIICSKD